MKDVLIRNIPDEVSEELNRLAKISKLSRQEFLKNILVDFVKSKNLSREEMEIGKVNSNLDKKTEMVLRKNYNAMKINLDLLENITRKIEIESNKLKMKEVSEWKLD